MKKFDLQQISKFNAKISELTSGFVFDHPETMIKKLIGSEDPEIYSGTIITAQGFARVAFDQSTKSLLLLSSKVADNLKGERNGEHIYPTIEGLKKSYILSARRFKPPSPLLSSGTARFFKDALDKHCNKMKERAANHFTLYGARLGKQDLYTNGRLAYIIDKNNSITFIAPSRFQGGRLIPVNVKHKSFLKKQIASTNNLQKARDQFARHWQRVSSTIWDEKDLYKIEGLKAKKILADLFDYSINNYETLGAGFAVSTLFAIMKDPALGGLLGAAWGAGHTGAHILSEESYRSLKKARQRIKQLRKRNHIDAYDHYEDASDFFKIATPENIIKLCPHIELKKINIRNLRFLSFEEVKKMLKDHTDPVENMQPGKLRGLSIFKHHRGHSSLACLPASNPHAHLAVFQSGLVRLMRERLNGKIDIFVSYRPDGCVLESQRLPKTYRDQIPDGQIEHIVYDRNKPSFSQSFEQSSISFEEMSHLLRSDLPLFPNIGTSNNFVPEICEEYKEATFNAVKGHFVFPDNANSKLFMSGTYQLPHMGVVL